MTINIKDGVSREGDLGKEMKVILKAGRIRALFYIVRNSSLALSEAIDA
jgi:hypothetical protein